MRRRFFIGWILLLILMLPFGGWCFDKQAPAEFAFKDLFPEGVEYVDLGPSVVIVTTVGQATGRYWYWTNYYAGEGEWRWGQGSFLVRGVGFVMEDPDNSQAKFIVTAGHCIYPGFVTITMNPRWRVITEAEEIIWSKTMIGIDESIEAAFPSRILYFNDEYDLAVLQVRDPNNILKPLQFPAAMTRGRTEDGSFDEIYSEDVVAMICRKRCDDGSWSSWFEVRWGKVVANYGLGPNEIAARWLNMEDITLELEIHPGDSGSPLFAFYKGKPLIIGVIRAMDSAGNSYAVRIDHAVPLLKGAIYPWLC